MSAHLRPSASPNAPEDDRSARLQSLGLADLQADDLSAALLARLALAEAAAAHDPVTGVWQSGAILGQLDQAHARAMRDQRPLGVLKLSAHFLGQDRDPAHDPIAAQILQAVGARLRDTLRGGDAIGRTGPCEFLCLLEGCDIAAARAVAERCRAAVSRLPVSFDQEGTRLTLVRARVALVMVHPNADILTQGILDQADALLGTAPESATETTPDADAPKVLVSVLGPAR